MTYENFLKITLRLQKQSIILEELNSHAIDLTNFVDPYHKMITILITEIYGEEGIGWFDWFCWENDFGHGGLTAHDSNGNMIAYSHESLWELLEKEYKK